MAKDRPQVYHTQVLGKPGKMGDFAPFDPGTGIYSVKPEGDGNGDGTKEKRSLLAGAVRDHLKGVGAAVVITVGQNTDRIPILRRFVESLPRTSDEADEQVEADVGRWVRETNRVIDETVRRREPANLGWMGLRIVRRQEEEGRRFLLPAREASASGPRAIVTDKERADADRYNAELMAGRDPEQWLAARAEQERKNLLETAGAMMADKLDYDELSPLLEREEIRVKASLRDTSSQGGEGNGQGPRGVRILHTSVKQTAFPITFLGTKGALGVRPGDNGDEETIDRDALIGDGVEVFIQPNGMVAVVKGGELRQIETVGDLGIKEFRPNSVQAALAMRQGRVLSVPILGPAARFLGRTVNRIMGGRDLVMPGAVELSSTRGGPNVQRIPVVDVSAARRAIDRAIGNFNNVDARLASIEENRRHALLEGRGLGAEIVRHYQEGLSGLPRQTMIRQLAEENRGGRSLPDGLDGGTPRPTGGPSQPGRSSTTREEPVSGVRRQVSPEEARKRTFLHAAEFLILSEDAKRAALARTNAAQSLTVEQATREAAGLFLRDKQTRNELRRKASETGNSAWYYQMLRNAAKLAAE